MISVSSWNTKQGLSSPERSGAIVEQVKSLDSDVCFISEAYKDNKFRAEDIASLEQEGYVVHSVQRCRGLSPGDDRARITQLFITRLSGEVSVLDDGSASLVSQHASLFGAQIRLTATHLDDRTERNRLHTLKKLFKDDNLPDVLMGDLNALHRNSRQAQILRTAVIKKMFERQPKERLRWIGKRLGEMAIGSTLDLIEMHQYSSGNLANECTFLAGGLALLELDYIFTRPDIKSDQFTVHSNIARGLSDHYPVSAVLRVAL